jgi:hypothetical protein
MGMEITDTAYCPSAARPSRSPSHEHHRHDADEPATDGFETDVVTAVSVGANSEI